MNATSKLIAVVTLSFAAGGAAFAQEATYEYPQVSTSNVTRAQVLAELQQARVDGSAVVSEGQTHKPAVFFAQRSRTEVRAEARAAVQGETNPLSFETNAFDVAVKPAPVKAGGAMVAGSSNVR